MVILWVCDVKKVDYELFDPFVKLAYGSPSKSMTMSRLSSLRWWVLRRLCSQILDLHTLLQYGQYGLHAGVRTVWKFGDGFFFVFFARHTSSLRKIPLHRDIGFSTGNSSKHRFREYLGPYWSFSVQFWCSPYLSFSGLLPLFDRQPIPHSVLAIEAYRLAFGSCDPAVSVSGSTESLPMWQRPFSWVLQSLSPCHARSHWVSNSESAHATSPISSFV